ncbi:uncharacterized protein PAC_19084 [Phialocephala subalpina]|uniref:Serine hydrolase domain-containing protein n=1 Tax=Phialocephala subalpina TaxID=576137 RepID=A0A1L7XVW7_9HELO|nr:uncharacterized protein PAC_19084 [Phialocephala subalpina]
MHILCLHGMGTNNQVFEIQTAALRYELGDQHTYEFVEGTIPCPIAPEISSLFNPDDSYYSYFDPNSVNSALEALRQLEEYIIAEGPFDGVLAFSQGAGLVAMHIIYQSLQNPRRNPVPPFKFAIFLSSIPVYDLRGVENGTGIRKLDPALDGHLIRIPTTHIWGEHEVHKADGELLESLCEQKMTATFVHDGGHEVPGLSGKSAVTGTVKAMRRSIFNALLLE